MEHTAIQQGEIHSPYQWIVTDAAARAALVPESTDADKLCLQRSDKRVYRLLTVSPVTWEVDHKHDAADITGLGAGFDGDYNSLSNKPTLGTAAPLNVAASGNAASGEVVKGNDTRLSDARTPTVHGHTTDDISGSYDATRLVGLVPIASMPPAALERLVVVANQAARYALTTANVQVGDTVKENDTGLMWYVKDDTQLGNAAGYEQYTAGQAAAVPWSGVTGKPTALQGGGTASQYVAGDMTLQPLGTAAPLNAPSSGNAAAGEVVKGNDTRLSDARTPTAHSHAATGISDSTSTGRALMTATDDAAARAALGLVSNAQGDVSLALSPTLTLVFDGTTDNGPIINAMLAAGWDTVEIPDSAAGCKIATQVILTTGKALRGVPGRSRIINGCDAVPMVVFRGSDTAVSDLNIECSLSNTSDVFRLDTATTGMERITLQNVLTTNGYGGLSDNGGGNYAINLRMERVHFRSHRGPGVTTTKAYGFTEINNTLVDRIGTASAANHPGFSFSGFQGISLDNCEVTGTKVIVSGTNSSQTGFVFSSGQVVFANKLFADTCGGVGLSFNTVDYVRPTNCTASLCDGIGMSFSSCNHIEATNLTVGGRNGTGAGNFTASIDGVAFATCGKVAVSTIAVRGCSGNGITKSGTSQVFAVTSYVLSSNTGRGLVDSSSGAAVFSGGVCTGNTAGNVSLASALQAIYATQISSGGFLNAQAGPYTG